MSENKKRLARVFVHNEFAGILEEVELQKKYKFKYLPSYDGPPVSLSMPVEEKIFSYKTFPPFFDGLLPEGVQLEGLLKIKKIDRYDYFSQLLAVGKDLVGAVTVEAYDEPQ